MPPASIAVTLRHDPKSLDLPIDMLYRDPLPRQLPIKRLLLQCQRSILAFLERYDSRNSGIWIQDSAPIYTDDYDNVATKYGSPPYPLPGDVIRLGSHVILIESVNPCESPYPVVTTSEKVRHSGIYHLVFDYWKGIDDDGYKDYYRPK